MLRIRTLGLTLVVAFTLGAVVASAASAALPEFKAPYPKAFTATSSVIRFRKDFNITCGNSKYEGKITERKTGSMTAKFSECKSPYGTCRSPGAEPAEIVTLPLAMKLGYIVKKTKEVGVELRPSPGETYLFTAACGELNIKVGGTVIGILNTINKETNEFDLEFSSFEGIEQVPSKLEGGLREPIIVSVDGGGGEEDVMETNMTILTEALTEVVA